MTVYAYRRFSAFELNDPSLADTADEIAQIQSYCDTHNLRDVHWQSEQADSWRDGFSARLRAPKSGHTPLDHKHMFHWLPESGDTVVVHSLPRIFSSAQDALTALGWMREQGIRLHVVDMQVDLSAPATKLDADNLLQALSIMESRRGAERMRTVKQGQRSKGRFLGGSKPFGYMVHANGKLIRNPMEQRVLKQIKQLRQQGWSLRAIAAKVSTPVAPISFKTVQRVLQRDDD